VSSFFTGSDATDDAPVVQRAEPLSIAGRSVVFFSFTVDRVVACQNYDRMGGVGWLSERSFSKEHDNKLREKTTTHSFCMTNPHSPVNFYCLGQQNWLLPLGISSIEAMSTAGQRCALLWDRWLTHFLDICMAQRPLRSGRVDCYGGNCSAISTNWNNRHGVARRIFSPVSGSVATLTWSTKWIRLTMLNGTVMVTATLISVRIADVSPVHWMDTCQIIDIIARSFGKLR
jgi:hypothetical protein